MLLTLRPRAFQKSSRSSSVVQGSRSEVVRVTLLSIDDERTLDMKLAGQIAVITGAGRNIGKAIANLFAAEGAKIAVVEMHEGRGQAVVDAINGAGHEAMLVLCDVS